MKESPIYCFDLLKISRSTFEHCNVNSKWLPKQTWFSLVPDSEIVFLLQTCSEQRQREETCTPSAVNRQHGQCTGHQGMLFIFTSLFHLLPYLIFYFFGNYLSVSQLFKTNQWRVFSWIKFLCMILRTLITL